MVPLVKFSHSRPLKTLDANQKKKASRNTGHGRLPITNAVAYDVELFDAPANTFVATFIGSPSMALLPAIGEGGSCRIEGLEGQLPLAAEGAFTLGVRPTDVLVGEGPLQARVDVVESLGAEALVHLILGESTAIVAQVPEPCGLQAGEVVPIGFGVTHAFDRQTGARLSR